MLAPLIMAVSDLVLDPWLKIGNQQQDTDVDRHCGHTHTMTSGPQLIGK